MLIFEIEGPQAERRDIEEKWQELHFSAPHIDLNQKEFNDSRNTLLKERKEALKGVDAHIDWLREALTIAAVESLAHEPEEFLQDQKYDKAIAEKVDSFLRKSRGNLSPDVLQILERDKERSKKLEDERVKREAEEAQKPLPGFEEAVKEAKSGKGKGKKAGPVKTSKVSDEGDPFFPNEEEQVPREETFKKPEESSDLDVFADMPEAEEKPKLTAVDGGKADKKPGKKTSKK